MAGALVMQLRFVEKNWAEINELAEGRKCGFGL
jgi:hypothetical protein